MRRSKTRYDSYVGILMPTDLAKIRSTDFTSPLGQNLLVTYLADRVPYFSGIVVDGERTEISKIEEIIMNLKAKKSLVGFSLLSGNSTSSFNLAQKLAEQGVDIVIGGPEVSGYGAAQIMGSRPFIKYGIIGAGERTLLTLVKGAGLDSIPNLTYYDNDGLHINPLNQEVAENIDWAGARIDYSFLVDIEKGNGVTYITGNDCFIAHDRCVFCGRMSMGNPSTKFESETRVQRVWDELSQAQKLGMRKFYNSADSVGVDFEHLRRFADSMPDGFEFDYHHMFFNAHEVIKEVVPILKRLNATIYLGIENIALKEATGKAGLTFLRHDLGALNILRDEGLPARVSFVLGLPGESNETMGENYEGILKLVENYPNICDLELNPVEILPGTKLFDMLIHSKRGIEFRNQIPPYDTIRMSELYADEFCLIPRSKTIEWIRKIYEKVKVIRPDLVINTKGISQEEYEIIKN